MKHKKTDNVGPPKIVLGLASFLSAGVGGNLFHEQGLNAPLGVVLGFFGYTLLGIATLKINQTMWRLAFGPEEDWVSREGRAWFIALWPLATGVSLTICPIVILVNTVI